MINDYNDLYFFCGGGERGIRSVLPTRINRTTPLIICTSLSSKTPLLEPLACLGGICGAVRRRQTASVLL